MASRGELEQAVMEILWESDAELSVAEVHKIMGQERQLAYTTVMTVLDRLAKKGMVTRELVARAWQYRPAQPRHLHVADQVRELIAPLDEQTKRLVVAELDADIAALEVASAG